MQNLDDSNFYINILNTHKLSCNLNEDEKKSIDDFVKLLQADGGGGDDYDISTVNKNLFIILINELSRNEKLKGFGYNYPKIIEFHTKNISKLSSNYEINFENTNKILDVELIAPIENTSNDNQDPLY